MSVAQAIAAHQAAVQFAAQFDSDTGADGDAACAAELEAFRAFALAPCLSHADVQAKLAHLLTNPLPINMTVADILLDYGDDVLPGFLESLRVAK